MGSKNRNVAFLMILSPIRVIPRIAADGVAKLTFLFLDRTGGTNRPKILHGSLPPYVEPSTSSRANLMILARSSSSFATA